MNRTECNAGQAPRTNIHRDCFLYTSIFTFLQHPLVTGPTSTTARLLLSILRVVVEFSLNSWEKFNLMLTGDNVSCMHF